MAVAAGFVLIGMGLLGAHEGVLIVVILAAALVPVVYSFFACRVIEGFRPPPQE